MTTSRPALAAAIAVASLMLTPSTARAGLEGACFLGAPNDCCADLSSSDCTAAGGSFQGAGTACHGSEVVEFANGLNLALPDNDPTGVSHTIEIAEHFVVTHMVIQLGITHTWVGDLCVTLEHDGVVVTLIARPGAEGGCHQGFPFGCDAENYVNILIGDGGTGGPIEDQCVDNLSFPPFSYSPNEPMEVFEGMNAAGAWTLTVSDNADGDVGVFTNWAIDLLPGPTCTGACCLEFDCQEAITAEECTTMGGFDFQPLKTCAEGCFGACCQDDGCYDCVCLGENFTELGCLNSFGFFNGPGTHCELAPGTCDPLLKGACCLPTGNCMIMLEGECDAAAGNFEGLLTTCSIPPCQACCLADGTCLYTASESTCTDAGGTFAGYSMPGGNGGNPPQPVKACCFGDGRCCRRLTQALCEAEGGAFQEFGNCQNCPSTGDTCPWDLNGSDAVEVLDLVVLIQNWGPCPGGCAADFDDNEDVGVLDLVAIIQNWGPCPPTAPCDG